ncbi:hypothetical protein [Dictyobacter aurantiacus]|uniref:DUF4386 domain-containing protein n=1 Tax=Dictyobacter aurantiacus TaxID=1936993 RepID=A0A401ZBD0_9CHLR|nr:hypothetical protein [Dictyobacter aurantiacus]GCE04028.1 hypothetical protein KDAU_13570 [Dictyobacter aurantiacus]
MKRSLLARLRSNGIYYIIAGLLLLLVIPLYQVLFLGPTGFSAALDATGLGRYTAYLAWISSHSLPFLIYRALLLCAFLLLISFPFNLNRIIVAQELMAQQEREEEERRTETEQADTADSEEEEEEDGLPAYPWRGKGFVVLAAWLGVVGLSIYLLGTAASSIYFILVASSTGAALQNSITTIAPIFSIITNVLGTGLLGLGCLFFGAMIARTGKNLWPGAWVAFGYASLFIGAMLSISAVAVLSAAGSGQSTLTTIATLLFAIWIIWLGAMLVRLKPEP